MGLLKQLTKRAVEHAASAELTEHLGYELAGEPPEGQPNRRNGWSPKTLITDHGSAEVDLPHDHDGSFEPQIVPKHQRRFAGFDDKIISMYARVMSTREISKHLEEIYGVEVAWGAETRSSCSGEFVFVDESAEPVVAVHPKRVRRQRYFGR